MAIMKSVVTIFCLLLMAIKNNNTMQYSNRTPENTGAKYTVIEGIKLTSQKPNSEHEVIVDSKMGSLRGMVSRHDNLVTTKFLGIPFALPPTREKRFLPPVKHFGWTFDTVWDATRHRKLCHQKQSDFDADFDFENEDYDEVTLDPRFGEDCLYLNLYIPVNISAVEHINTLGLPVMVFLHGDEFSHGVRYDGQKLANNGNVIVATLDFRQGIFGYFSIMQGVAPGNVGLLDQRLALHWIWDNVQEFGGNPSEITIFGDGKGAQDVGFHIVSPMSKGLFSRAILQSGSMLTPGALQTTPVDNARSIINLLGCSIYDNDTDKVACLRSEPVEHLVKVSGARQWEKVIDGSFLIEDPAATLQHGRHNKVSIIVGVDRNHADAITSEKGYTLEIGVTKADLELEIRRALGPAFKEKLEQVVSLTLAEYDFCEKSPSERFQTLQNFLRDYYYVYPCYETAKLISRSDRAVYLYEFSHDLPDTRTANEFVFGYAGSGRSQQEEELSDIIIEGWTNFAAEGDPNPINLRRGTYWFPFNLTYERYLTLTPGTMDHTAGSQERLERRAAAFWEFLNALRQVPASQEDTCTPGRDVCAHRVRSVEEQKHHTAMIMWILAGVCGLLVVVIVLLLLKLFVPSSTWQYSHPANAHKLTSASDPDRRYLRPLPYYDET